MAGPILATGDVLHFTAEGLLFQQHTITNFYYAVTDNADGEDLEAALDTWTTVNADQMLPPIMSTDWVFLRTTADIIHPVIRRSAQVVSSQEFRNGQIAGGSLPPSVTFVIARRTSTRGPTGRGRVFIPGVPTAWHDDGSLTGAAITAVGAVLDDFALPLAFGGFNAIPALYRRVPSGFIVVEQWTLDHILRSQRRREIGIGI
jgi:hypothetical protein